MIRVHNFLPDAHIYMHVICAGFRNHHKLHVVRCLTENSDTRINTLKLKFVRIFCKIKSLKNYLPQLHKDWGLIHYHVWINFLNSKGDCGKKHRTWVSQIWESYKSFGLFFIAVTWLITKDQYLDLHETVDGFRYFHYQSFNGSKLKTNFLSIIPM